ncbi:MAG: sulfite exporter TauE/SafE family protein [Oscillospiraceae bacterium]
MIFLIYGAIIFIATFLGAFVGLGGGVIIKPVLDVIGVHTLREIAFFSSCAVFAMSVTSTGRHIKNKTPINSKIVLLIAGGSILGGTFGNKLFNFALESAAMPNFVKGIQSILLSVFLICVILSVTMKLKTYSVKNPVAILFSGLILGTAASFLGIGGGPINVAFLTLMFSFTMKDAAVYSVAIIFFSQLSNLITTFVNTGFKGFDLKILLAIIPLAIIGGFLGSIFNRKCSEKTIKKTFIISVSAIVLLSGYNAVMSFI